MSTSAMEPFNVGRSAYRLLFDFGVMLSCFSTSPNKRVLDFGAGTGWISEFLARSGYEVYALDIDTGMPDSIRTRLLSDTRLSPTSITTLIGSGMDLPFPDGFFSHLCCFDTLHHMSDYPRTFQEMSRVLASGGRAVFIEPGARHSQSKETKAFIETYKKDDPTWIERDVLLEEIEQISKESGFSKMIVLPVLLPGLKNYTASQWEKFRKGDLTLAKDYLTLLKDFNYNDHLSFYCEKGEFSTMGLGTPLIADSKKEMSSILSKKKIAIDLTPMLPGGENGGAKPMTLELIHALASLLQTTSFVLLTAEISHAELDPMEREHSNIQRVCVLHNSPQTNSSVVAAAPVSTWYDGVLDHVKALTRRVLPSPLKKRIKRWLWAAKPVTSSVSLLGQMNADLLFCPFTAPFYAEPLIPTVSVIYDLQFRAFPQFFTPKDLIQREDNFETACQRADYLVAISEFVRKTVIETADLSPERVIAVPIGLLHAHEKSDAGITDDDLVMESLSLRRQEYILYPANFWQHKNHAMLLTAFNLYRHAQPDSPIKLVCTGAPGPGAEAFCEAAHRMGLADWVIYPGYVASEEYGHLLRSAFALVFPSLYEGFGIPVLEAMAAGVPVMCSNVTSLPEVGGDAVLYFDPHRPTQIVDVLTRLSEEPGLRESLIARGLKRCLQFDGADRMAMQYADVLAKALTPKNRKFKNAISGVFPDGWTGKSIKVLFSSTESSSQRTLLVHLESPHWLASPVQVQVVQDDVDVSQSIKIKPGDKTQVKVPLPNKGGVVEISLYPTFIPNAQDSGADSRELGLRCLYCKILDTDGTVLILFES